MAVCMFVVYDINIHFQSRYIVDYNFNDSMILIESKDVVSSSKANVSLACLVTLVK